jgi:hypothetical protein
VADLIFVLATFVFFAICVFYVNWCDRIIGPDDFGTSTLDTHPSGGAEDAPTEPTRVAA